MLNESKFTLRQLLYEEEPISTIYFFDKDLVFGNNKLFVIIV